MEGEITRILQAAGAGGKLPSEDLLPLVYAELRGLATARMAGAPGQTLQPTALVHEAWLRLVGNKDSTWNDRAHFFRAAALAMRCILVDRARKKACLKRDCGKERVELDDVEIEAGVKDESILQVNEALDRLEQEDPESARIVMLKFFGGLTNKEIARADGVSVRTIESKWAFAKTSLFHLIQENAG
ncbi:MAG: ECF-type sigma factor [Akkermansiaceae bacterium]